MLGRKKYKNIRQIKVNIIEKQLRGIPKCQPEELGGHIFWLILKLSIGLHVAEREKCQNVTIYTD